MERDHKGRVWPDYRTLWRWHFYAGLICIPFVLWLSVTGTIYLFRPQIESVLDRPYDTLPVGGAPAPVAAQVHAALRAAPGSAFQAYQIPDAPNAAARVLLVKGDDAFRVYVQPDTLRILHVVKEDDRLMRQVFHLHGELLLGDTGSMIVETTACWALVMIATGVALWWPRGARGVAGVLAPRVGSKFFLRDLHAVTGAWVSALALFLIITGLPWAKNWGNYLKEVRAITGTMDGPQDWNTGRASELAQRRQAATRARAGGSAARDRAPADRLSPDAGPMSGDHMRPGENTEAGEHMAHRGHRVGMDMSAGQVDFTALDRLLPAVAAMRLAPPVLITPPKNPHGAWTARSDSANRPLRATLTLDGETGAVINRKDFNQRHPIDQAIGIGVAAHEGQLFGWPNQLISLLATSGLVTLSLSAMALWLRRRPSGGLGAPAEVLPAQLTAPLTIALIALSVLMPLWGASALLVVALERVVLRRMPVVGAWLGFPRIDHPPQIA